MPQPGEVRQGKEIGKLPKAAKFIWHICIACGKERWVLVVKGKPKPKNEICHDCYLNRGKRCHYERGYKLVKLYPDDPFYPMANNKGFVREHRLVVARALGRCLRLGEIVHHKHGFAKDDNRYPETLQLNTIDGHNTITAMQNKIDALERRIAELLQNNKK